ncbi:MAG: phosphatidylglycerophosphatase A [Nitrospirae bacterium]|nr:phosphatidylglycerophosphatase A [Nitrospirota bacterium]
MLKYQVMNALFRLLPKAIATVFYIGRIPFAPGTFGSLAGMAFVWFLKPGIPLQTALAAAGFVIGILSAHFAERDFGEKDSRHIVIDEFVGYLVSVIALPLTAGYLVSAFCLFRFFDILKPPPIRNLEKIFSGGIGVMIDDVVAGIFTNVILQLWRFV